MKYFIAILLICLVMPVISYSQSGVDSLPNFSKMVDRTSKVLSSSITDIGKQNSKIVDETEDKIAVFLNKLKSIDKLAAKDLSMQLDAYSTKSLLLTINQLPQKFHGEYLPYLDSAFGIMSFLKSKSPNLKGITENLDAIKELQHQISAAQEIQQHLQQKLSVIDQFVKANQQKLSKLEARLNKMHSNIAEYSGKIRSVKEVFRDPSKLQEQALAILSTNSQFSSFMQKNSFLSGLFPGNATPANTDASIGLFSRASLTEEISKKIQSSVAETGPVTSKMTVSENVGNSGLSEILNSLPGNKQNIPTERTVERKYNFHFTLQTTRANSIYPSMADFALTAGYNIKKKFSIGGGISYKMGMGTGINDIRISSQGVGFRSYADYKWKKALFVTTGFEMNYIEPFSEVRNLTAIDKWTTSGLIGITKSIDFKSHFIKGMRLQLFWDFLAQGRNVQTQPILFRIGYSF